MNFHKIFNSKYSAWEEIENLLAPIETQKEKGDAFEQFAYAYFLYFREIYQIKELYMWQDIPAEYRAKYKLEKKDNGVDGLIIQENGDAVAYQVKFRNPQNPLVYDDLTSFWTESEYADGRCIFANSYSLPKQAMKKKGQFAILRDSLTALDEDFYQWLFEFATQQKTQKKIKKFSPRPHQDKMIREVVAGFQSADRGKMLAACGTGKTLTALWIKEKLECKQVLFVAPNLALIKQTLEAWMPQTSNPFSYLCVCSDETVADAAASDEYVTDCSYIDVPVTTSSEDIAAFIAHKTEKDKVIFSTYQSLDAVVAAMKKVPDSCFDIAFFDEAHRTAGSKDSEMFVLGMHNEFIPCQKRLFMTATERFVKPCVSGKAQELNYEVFSMDNPEQYGQTFSSLPFREAIDAGIISDYKIVLCCMKESEISSLIEHNTYIKVGEQETTAKTLFKQIMLAKTMGDIGVKKVISYHRKIDFAKEFIGENAVCSLKDIISAVSPDIAGVDIHTDHINGQMSAGARKKIFDSFIQSPYGVISNARCLTEGVDVPIIDAVYFSDPKDSIIDIIQAVGRSLRKDNSKPDKVSYIVIPVIIPDSISKFEDIDPAEFTTLHAVIQALRDQDRILADFIDKANLNAAKGHGGGNGGGGGDPAPLVISTPVDMTDFTDGLYLRIAEVNKDPGNITPEFIVGTKRTSGVTRMFRTVGDYNIEAYYEGLVLPTLKKYPDLTTGLSRTDIVLDHNNVSHCVKIGALEERNKKFYITDIGKALIEYEDLYVDIFKEQMLKYYELDAITKVPRFPYRMAFRVFAEVGYLTQFELAYSLYIVRGIGEAGENEAIERVKFLRETYPNIEILNQTNKELVLNILNTKYNTTLTFADIWTSRTTVYNQFNYIKKHLFAFSDIFDNNSPKNVIRLLPGGKEKILDLLLKTKEITTCPMDTLKKYFMQYKGY